MPYCIDECSVNPDLSIEENRDQFFTQTEIDFIVLKLSEFGVSVGTGPSTAPDIDDEWQEFAEKEWNGLAPEQQLEALEAIYSSVHAVGSSLAGGSNLPAAQAFRNVYSNGVTFFYRSADPFTEDIRSHCDNQPGLACGVGNNTIIFSGFTEPNYGFSEAVGYQQLLVHELGHVFANVKGLNTYNDETAGPLLWGSAPNNPSFIPNVQDDLYFTVANTDNLNELFADVFANWVNTTRPNHQWWQFMEKVAVGENGVLCVANCW